MTWSILQTNALNRWWHRLRRYIHW